MATGITGVPAPTPTGTGGSSYYGSAGGWGGQSDFDLKYKRWLEQQAAAGTPNSVSSGGPIAQQFSTMGNPADVQRAQSEVMQNQQYQQRYAQEQQAAIVPSQVQSASQDGVGRTPRVIPNGQPPSQANPPAQAQAPQVGTRINPGTVPASRKSLNGGYHSSAMRRIV